MNMRKDYCTDLDILNMIYSMYKERFRSNIAEYPFMKIDINVVSEKLNIAGDELYCRLYYYLEPKYRSIDDKGIRSFFPGKEISGMYEINFPMLISIMSEIQESKDIKDRSINIAGFSVLISIVSLLCAIFRFK